VARLNDNDGFKDFTLDQRRDLRALSCRAMCSAAKSFLPKTVLWHPSQGLKFRPTSSKMPNQLCHGRKKW